MTRFAAAVAACVEAQGPKRSCLGAFPAEGGSLTVHASGIAQVLAEQVDTSPARAVVLGQGPAPGACLAPLAAGLAAAVLVRPFG